jgi:ATP-binding cassette subfamily C protein CydD
VKPLDPRLLQHARTSRRYLATTVVLGVLVAGLIVAQATLLAHGITAVFLHGATAAALLPTLLTLAAVILARALLAWAQEAAAVRSSAAVKSELRNRLYAHLVALGPVVHNPALSTGAPRDLQKHATIENGGGPAGGGSPERGSPERSSRDTGAVITLVTRGLDALDAYFARYLPQLVLAALIPAVVLVRLVGADLIATVTIALTLPLIPVFMALVELQTEAANRRQFRLLARLSHHFLDVVAGLPTLKIFGRAGAQTATIGRISREQRRLTMRTLRLAFLSSLVLELLATLSVALVAVGIGLRLVDGRLGLETALLVLILAPEAYLPLRQVGANFHASAEGLAAAEEAFAILETPVAEEGTAPAPHGDIVFEDVVVRYRGRDALRLTATVRPGEIVALTGPSGCGKSTALGVLLGFVRPDAGRVTVGGTDLSTVDPVAWRANLAWVPQRPHLFAGTVRENIALGDPPTELLLADLPAPTAFASCFGATPNSAPAKHHPTAGDPTAGDPTASGPTGTGPAGTGPAASGPAGERPAGSGPVKGGVSVAEAARLAGADRFVDGLPAGFETVLGDDGGGLSAGQRQRIALARAFRRDAPIVLLDEPTANLDRATAEEVMAAIRRLAHGRTVVVAAHRPELIALADRVVELAPAGVR